MSLVTCYLFFLSIFFFLYAPKFRHPLPRPSSPPFSLLGVHVYLGDGIQFLDRPTGVLLILFPLPRTCLLSSYLSAIPRSSGAFRCSSRFSCPSYLPLSLVFLSSASPHPSHFSSQTWSFGKMDVSPQNVNIFDLPNTGNCSVKCSFLDMDQFLSPNEIAIPFHRFIFDH